MCFSSAASFSSSCFLYAIGTLGLFVNRGVLLKCKHWSNTLWGIVIGQGKIVGEQRVLDYVNDSRFWWLFLFTPLFFATQQLSEGFVWLRVAKTDTPSAAAYIFSFFAFCFWPLWVPCVCLVMEMRWYHYFIGHSKVSVTLPKPLPNSKPGYQSWLIRMFVLSLLQLLGILLFCYMLSSLSMNNLSVTSCSDHILYHFKTLPFKGKGPFFITIPYLLCTVTPFALVRGTAYTWLLSVSVGLSAILSYVFYSAKTFPSTWCFFSAWISIITVFIRGYDAYSYSNKDSTTFHPANILVIIDEKDVDIVASDCQMIDKIIIENDHDCKAEGEHVEVTTTLYSSICAKDVDECDDCIC